MANKRSTPTTPPGTSLINPRGPSVADMDRISGHSDESGILLSQEEQGSPANNRGERGSGAREASSVPSEGDRGPTTPLSSPLALPSTVIQGERNPFQSADGVLKTIADRFNAAREQGKVGAWRQFQKDLMNASPFLVPILLPYKDLISIVAEIEKEIKGSTAQAGKSNEELLADFLSGNSSLGADISSPVPEGIDTTAKIVSGDSVAS